MKMTNLGHKVAHLEYSKFINIRMWLRTNARGVNYAESINMNNLCNYY